MAHMNMYVYLNISWQAYHVRWLCVFLGPCHFHICQGIECIFLEA